MSSKFDKKFGAQFISAIPVLPGVYRIFNEAGELIYVGKAKNLRRRLSQYRNAKRIRAHKKMRAVIAEAVRIETEVCESEGQALLVETRCIQEKRPRWNVVGAYSFLYPFVGMKLEDGVLWFVMTTKPEEFPGFRLFGAFRSRDITGEAFFGLMRCLKYCAHMQKAQKLRELRLRPRYSHLFGFRNVPAELMPLWEKFFRGESAQLLEELCLLMLENAGARRDAMQIQVDLKAFKRFWKHEVLLLKRVLDGLKYTSYPVPQKERDVLFLQYRYRHEIKPVAENGPQAI